MLAAEGNSATLFVCLAVFNLAATAVSFLILFRKQRQLTRQAESNRRAPGQPEAGKKQNLPPQKAAHSPLASPGTGSDVGPPQGDPEARLTAAAVARMRSMARERRLRITLLVGSVVVTAGLAELGLRRFDKQNLRVERDEKSLMYRYDENLGWFPIPHTHQRVEASRPVTVTHNSEGFRDWEHPPSAKPGVVFLGDSFVWGYDVEASERFTDKLQARHPEWSIYNLGVSGYGTDQELLLLQLIFDQYKPKVVCLVFSTETDRDDNTTNVRYGSYYKPYFSLETNRLQLKGVPVPRCERVFWAEHPRVASSYLARLLVRDYFKLTSPAPLTNPDPTQELIGYMQRYVQRKGANFVVGLTRNDPGLEAYLRSLKIAYVDLSTPLRYPQFGGHWTPQGHTIVADRIEELLRKGKFLEPENQPVS